MSSYKYYKPFYLPSFTPIYPLASYGDNDTMFFSVKYRIRPDHFKSRTKGDTIYPPLEDIFDYRGRPVVPIWVDKKKYRLLSETVVFNGFYNEVEEVYGFTPTNVFTKKNITAWVRPALEANYDTNKEIIVVDKIENNVENRNHKLSFYSQIHTMKVGDVVEIKSDFYTTVDHDGKEIKAYQKGNSIVSAIESNSIIIEQFNLTEYGINGNTLNDIQSLSEQSALVKNISVSASFNISDLMFGLISGVEASNKRIRFSLDAEKRITTGDIIIFTAPYTHWNGWYWYGYRSYEMEVVETTANYFFVEDFLVTNTGGSYQNNYSDRPQKSGYIKRVATSARPSYSGDFIGNVVISFVRADELPKLKQPWKAIKGKSFVDAIGQGTIPTISEYQEMILRGEQLLAQPQQAQKLLGDIYIITSTYVDAQ